MINKDLWYEILPHFNETEKLEYRHISPDSYTVNRRTENSYKLINYLDRLYKKILI
jgi:hypothetical protein